MKLEKYTNGFRLISALDPCAGVRHYPVANGEKIDRHRVLVFAAGYVKHAASLQGTKLAGIAVSENTAAEASAAGAVDAEVIPLLPQHQFAVPVEQDALITQADVGDLYDLESANTIDLADAVTLGFGFFIDAIDDSDEAVAANTFGFAIGHFEYIAAS